MRDYRARTPIIEITTSGVRTNLYTCPNNCRTKVPLVYIVNANGNVGIDLEIYKSDADRYFFILSGKNLSLGQSVQLDNAYVVLEPGDGIFVKATGTTPRVDALCTVEETFIPVG